VATKLEAFLKRGGGDYIASHDLEDIVTVVDGSQGRLPVIYDRLRILAST
jgi:hypothetical protein